MTKKLTMSDHRVARDTDVSATHSSPPGLVIESRTVRAENDQEAQASQAQGDHDGVAQTYVRPHRTNRSLGEADIAKASELLRRYLTTPLSTTQLRVGVFVFAGAGGNVVAIGGSRGCAVVDTGYGPRVVEIENAIEVALGQAPRWLIDTHWHFDHTDGNATFADAGAMIFAHTNCRARMSQDHLVPSLNWRIPASPRIAWPAITFDQPLSIDLGSETLELLPQAPAHTDGDVAVFLQSANVLVMGDLFTHGSYPVIDEYSGGSLRGMIVAINKLLPMIDADTVVVPGDGTATDRSGLLAFRDMLCRVEDRIQSMIVAGRGAPEIVAAKPTAEFDPVWGRGYVTGPLFTGMVLAGLGLTSQSAPPAP